MRPHTLPAGDEVRTGPQDVVQQAARTLADLVQEKIVLSYGVVFKAGRLVVTARISAQDELSRARAKRRVQAALDLVAPGTTVAIVSVQPVEGWG